MDSVLVTKAGIVYHFVKKTQIVLVAKSASMVDAEHSVHLETNVLNVNYVLREYVYQAVIPTEIVETTCYVLQNYVSLLVVKIHVAKMLCV